MQRDSQRDNETVNYKQTENDSFSFESFIVCLWCLNHIYQTSWMTQYLSSRTMVDNSQEYGL